MTLWHIKSLKFMLQILTLYFCVTGEYLLSIITLCNGSGGSVCVCMCVRSHTCSLQEWGKTRRGKGKEENKRSFMPSKVRSVSLMKVTE